MSEAQVAARLQERVEELCAASIRALTGQAELRFRGRRLHRGTTRLPLFAPHLHPSLEGDDFASFRGAADGLALRLMLSDAALHASLLPADAVERLLFDWLEQFRVESLAPARLPGVARNLRHRHEAWSLGFHGAGHADSARGLLLYTLAQVARARVTAEPVVEATEDRIEATRFALAPRIGHALAGLRRARHDQRAYAMLALSIAATVAAMLRDTGSASKAEAPADSQRDDDARSVFGLLLEEDEQGTSGERFAVAVSGRSLALDAMAGGYRVFTTAYDRQVDAGALARTEVLTAYRAQLDRRIAGQGVNLPRLARALRELLAVPAQDGWAGAQEEGRIDGRTLARLVATPSERRLFRQERSQPHGDAAVGFLVDCSGSMKQHAESVAMLTDVFARALEMAEVPVEILGFTTGAWNGGRARRAWQRAGRPPQPGRLNEGLHIVYKAFGTPWRRARPAMAALLKADLFREGIDGEAVDWACARLLAREAGRRILFVVSDGSPMDTATALANDAHYLDQHLRDVVQRHEQSGAIEIFGLGVGLDLSPFYSRSHVLDLGGAIGAAMFGEVVDLLAGRRPQVRQNSLTGGERSE
jgi:cobaltochelatase CobT